MERSHAKLTQWAVAFNMAASSKKGFSAHQLHRELGCQYNTAWFLHHRVMEAMRQGGLDLPPMGGEGKIVEADETYFGEQPKKPRISQTRGRPYHQERPNGPADKRAIVSLVERGGKVRSFHVPRADGGLSQDRARQHRPRKPPTYRRKQTLHGVGKDFAAHETVKHGAKSMRAAT